MYLYISIFFEILTICLCCLIALISLSEEPENRLFFSLCITICFWVASNLIVDLRISYEISLLFSRLSIIWVSIIPLFFSKLIFRLFPESIPRVKNLQIILQKISISILIFFIIFNQTKYNISNIEFNTWGVNFSPGVFYIILFFYLIVNFWFIWKYLQLNLKIVDHYKQQQIKYILYGSILAVLMGIGLDIVLPLLGYSNLSSITPTSILLFLYFMFIAIKKFNLFNIKIFAIQIIIFSILIIESVKLIIEIHTKNVPYNIFILSSILIFGILLNRSIKRIIMLQEENSKLVEKIKMLNKSWDLDI